MDGEPLVSVSSDLFIQCITMAPLLNQYLSNFDFMEQN